MIEGEVISAHFEGQGEFQFTIFASNLPWKVSSDEQRWHSEPFTVDTW